MEHNGVWRPPPHFIASSWCVCVFAVGAVTFTRCAPYVFGVCVYDAVEKKGMALKNKNGTSANCEHRISPRPLKAPALMHDCMMMCTHHVVLEVFVWRASREHRRYPAGFSAFAIFTQLESTPSIVSHRYVANVMTTCNDDIWLFVSIFD